MHDNRTEKSSRTSSPRREADTRTRARRAYLERAFVVLSLTLLMGAVLALIRHSAAGGPGTPIEDPLQQVVFAFIYLLAGLFAMRARTRILQLLRASPELLGLLIWTGVSVSWSTAPDVSLRRLAAILGTSFFGFYIVGRFGLRGAIQLLAWSLAISMFGSLIIAIAMPQLGILDPSVGAWNGLFSHKNMLGRAAALGFLTFATMTWLEGRTGSRLFYFALMVLSGGLLVLSNSITSIVTILGVLAAIPVVIGVSRRTLGMAALVSALVGIGSACAVLLLSNPSASLLAVGRVGTFTGRTELWGLAFEHVSTSPLLGHGYSGFWLAWDGPSAQVWQAITWFPLDAHNGYLDVLLDLGFIGGILFLAVLVVSLSRTANLLPKQFSLPTLWGATYLILFLLYNLAESIALEQNSVYWVLFCGAVSAIALEARARSVPSIARQGMAV